MDKSHRLEQPRRFATRIPDMMRAWVLRSENLCGPSSFREERVPVPEPGPTDVVVANVMAGVNFNGVWASHGQPVDVVAGNSAYDPDSIGFHICGSESSGIVAAVGSEVTAVKIGDKVIVSAGQFDSNDPMIRKGSSPELAPSYRIWGYESSWGAFGEFSRVQERQCMPKPDELGWEQAATCLATGVPVHRMLTHWQGNQIKPGDVVLVWGDRVAWGRQRFGRLWLTVVGRSQ